MSRAMFHHFDGGHLRFAKLLATQLKWFVLAILIALVALFVAVRWIAHCSGNREGPCSLEQPIFRTD